MITIREPKTYAYFIDRFLISAEAYNIPTTLIFNKIDLHSEQDDKEMEELISIYSKIGYHCIKTSVDENINIEEVKAEMKGKTSVISGHSGVGKTTLLNTIEPSLDLKKIREAASKTFLTVSVPFINYSSKTKIVKKALEIAEIGADSIHCGSWNINFMKFLNEFKIMACHKIKNRIFL